MKRSLLPTTLLLAVSTTCITAVPAFGQAEEATPTPAEATAMEVTPGAAATIEAPAVTVEQLGQVRWAASFETAQKACEETGRPIFLLFREAGAPLSVTGLDHPLLADAVSESFIPVQILRPGESPESEEPSEGEPPAKTLLANEPLAGPPAIRILDENGYPLDKRLRLDGATALRPEPALARTLVRALEKADRPVPTYLDLLDDELSVDRAKIEKATFAMHCFWEGEGALAEVPGVVLTRPGFVEDREVVEVRFDPTRIPYEELLRRAKAMECATTVYTRSNSQQRIAARVHPDAAKRTDEPIRIDRAPKYWLSRTPIRHVPMTELQAGRVNAAIGNEKDPVALLSSSQRDLLEILLKNPDAEWANAIGVRLDTAWPAALEIARSVSSNE